MYDVTGRLRSQARTLDGKTEPLSTLCYNDLGQLQRKTLGGDLQTLDYAYNIRGWLTQTNDPSDLGTDLFAFGLDYLPNGNIDKMDWRHPGETTSEYDFTYDALNRIKTATHSNGSYTVSGITYDKNGNIETLNRTGYLGSSFGAIDQLSYSYNGNQLQAVQDAVEADYGFKDGANTTTEYTYDSNGNMLSDANKGITSIAYNHLK